MADKPEATAAAEHSAVSGNVQEFQREYLRSVVTECMEDFTSEVRKQLWHIEWDIARNFQLLEEKNEMRQEEFNRTYENLISENQMLREENEALKRTRRFYQE